MGPRNTRTLDEHTCCLASGETQLQLGLCEKALAGRLCGALDLIEPEPRELYLKPHAGHTADGTGLADAGDKEIVIWSHPP